MFLFTSVVELLGVGLVIESGRARAQSTKVLGSYFTDNKVEIKSIENKKFTQDSIIAMNQLKGYPNIELLYGNSTDLILKQVTRPCTVLIDGPKRHEAIKLCLQIIKDENVKAIGIHDVNKNTIFRHIIRSIFTDTIFSDENNFVSRYSYLDDRVWSTLPKYKMTRDWAPYRVGDKKMENYGPTLGIIFNNKNPVRKDIADVYLTTLLDLERKIKQDLHGKAWNIIRDYSEKLIYYLSFQLAYKDYISSIKLDILKSGK